ncbi:hypothetical protein ACSXBP_11405 [Clostridium perfringens]|uniref:hypothetical protein n=1 Tax=Clostridium perfringens TaxID=1502 RepID=UPI00189BF392|nr:hypothetical protein [Clostridium perfringens]HAT4093242.1 hypothetical protein [Clostridium perfringens]
MINKLRKKNDDKSNIQSKPKLTFKEKRKVKKEFKVKKKEEKIQKKVDKKKRKEALKNIQHKTIELLPLVAMTEKRNFECKDEYLDIFQIRSVDTNAMNNYDTTVYILSLTRILKMYVDDIKVISMNFPANTQKQQDYINKKIANCKNELHLKFLKNRKMQLEAIEKIRTNREFYIMIFGETEEELERNKKTLFNSASFIKILKLDDEKKIKILRKLNNMNTKI